MTYMFTPKELSALFTYKELQGKGIVREPFVARNHYANNPNRDHYVYIVVGADNPQGWQGYILHDDLLWRILAFRYVTLESGLQIKSFTGYFSKAEAGELLQKVQKMAGTTKEE